MSLQPELQRRITNTDKVLALFRASPLQWLEVHAFMQIAGSMAWRTRISDARKVIEAEGGRIENHQIREHGVVISLYRYVPYVPLGPSAETRRDQLGLF